MTRSLALRFELRKDKRITSSIIAFSLYLMLATKTKGHRFHRLRMWEGMCMFMANEWHGLTPCGSTPPHYHQNENPTNTSKMNVLGSPPPPHSKHRREPSKESLNGENAEICSVERTTSIASEEVSLPTWGGEHKHVKFVIPHYYIAHEPPDMRGV